MDNFFVDFDYDFSYNHKGFQFHLITFKFLKNTRFWLDYMLRTVLLSSIFLSKLQKQLYNSHNHHKNTSFSATHSSRPYSRLYGLEIHESF